MSMDSSGLVELSLGVCVLMSICLRQATSLPAKGGVLGPEDIVSVLLRSWCKHICS